MQKLSEAVFCTAHLKNSQIRSAKIKRSGFLRRSFKEFTNPACKN
ncbi:Uncharacterized protein dnm_053450 [Desulfonema magnum]|uniref:Uncharacterized protein n=1 Tax=Desulfonema magnum TaxID=45655 RepID=A0A975GPX7_9BACT|nr:Uncharacterized protein dnm_053450 [Desulfonema magnum]